MLTPTYRLLNFRLLAWRKKPTNSVLSMKGWVPHASATARVEPVPMTRGIRPCNIACNPLQWCGHTVRHHTQHLVISFRPTSTKLWKGALIHAFEFPMSCYRVRYCGKRLHRASFGCNLSECDLAPTLAALHAISCATISEVNTRCSIARSVAQRNQSSCGNICFSCRSSWATFMTNQAGKAWIMSGKGCDIVSCCEAHLSLTARTEEFAENVAILPRLGCASLTGADRYWWKSCIVGGVFPGGRAE